MKRHNLQLKLNEDIELRQLQLDDALDIFQTIDSQRDYLGKWLPFVEYTQKPEDSAQFVKEALDLPADKQEYLFAIRATGLFIGLIGFKDTDKVNRKTEIGYWLREEYQGKGIVSAAVKALCDFAFGELHMNRIQIKCAVGNFPSKRIPQRLGFTFEGIERQAELLTGGVFTDLEIYSLLNAECIPTKRTN